MTPEQFNDRYPVGTPCRYWPNMKTGPGRSSVTRTEAWRMESGAVVVSVVGYAGGIALTHVEMMPSGPHEPPATPDAGRSPSTIRTPADLAALPPNAVVRDRYGDVGVVRAGRIHFPETQPQTFERAAKKYGPFVDVVAEARAQGAAHPLLVRTLALLA